jgi:CHAD domain-containing protein
LRRIARARIAAAIKLVESRSLTDEAVHSVRKNLKQARAMLRLLRPSIGTSAYRRENRSLRNCARRFSMLRDSRVLLDTAIMLRARARSADERAVMRSLEALLEHDHTLAERALTADRATIDSMRKTLRSSYRRSAHWLAPHGADSPGRGVMRVYSHGRAAQERAQAHGSAPNLHELRKQTEYLYHQLDALATLQPDRITRLAKRMHRLADMLGDDHNLTVLRTRVTHSALARPDRIRLRRLIDHARAKVGHTALAKARHIYRQRPAVLAARLNHCPPPQ